MNVEEVHERLTDSSKFEEWISENDEHYLVNFFADISEDLNPQNWEVGYYNPNEDKITTFEIDDEINQTEPDDVFKKKQTVNELSLDNVEVSAEEALDEVKDLQEEKYAQNSPLKGFLILQNKDDLGTVWNAILITQSFNTLNIKLDAATGDIEEHELSTLFDIADVEDTSDEE